MLSVVVPNEVERVSPVNTSGYVAARFVSSDMSIDVPRVAVSAPPESERPVPRRLLNKLPLTTRLVVEAVRNDE